MKKKLDSATLIAAVVISALLFIGGVVVGYSINREKLSAIESDMGDITRAIENFQLQFLFFDVLEEGAACPLLSATVTDINEASYRIGSRLTAQDSPDQIQDYTEYVNLKREYSRILVSYWLLANKLKNTCESNVSTVIYFYSEECPMCDDQGFVLTYLKSKEEENLLIFALDADLDEPSVKALKEYYSVGVFPTLIIDGERFEGFSSEQELRDILGIRNNGG